MTNIAITIGVQEYEFLIPLKYTANDAKKNCRENITSQNLGRWMAYFKFFSVAIANFFSCSYIFSTKIADDAEWGKFLLAFFSISKKAKT